VFRAKAPKAKDFTNWQCKWKRGVDEAIKAKKRTKSRIRSRVEHSIVVIKRVFGFRRLRYGGLAKSGNRLFVTAALANIFLVRSPCWEQSAHGEETRPERPDFSMNVQFAACVDSRSAFTPNK
jgi:hypothetical protein